MIVWWFASILVTAIASCMAMRHWLISCDPDETRQRQELERALRISQQNYRSIVEDQTEMILRFNRDGVVTFANKAYCNRYGMTPEQAIGSNCFLNIHPDYRQAALKIVQEVTSAQPTGVSVIKVQRPDGSQDWAEWNGRALYDVDGTHLGYQAIGRIVTDLVETQKRLAESELQYRTIVEDQSEMIIRFDRNGIITFANSAYMQANNLSSDQVTQSSIWDYVQPEDHARVRAAVEALTPKQPTERLRLRMERDGTDFWEDWYGHALYDDDGKFMCVQAVGRDVTKLVQAEDELRKKEGLLRHASRLSTLGEMVAVITHELRQPLYSINNFAFACERQLAQTNDVVSEKLKSWNHDIIGQVGRANDIVTRLRGFARRSDSVVSCVSMNTIARDSVAMLQFELNLASINVLEDFDGALPESSVDRLQMEQVMINLVRNAYEALTSANVTNPTIICRTERTGDVIKVSVEDNGPGLPESELESIFQPFSTSKTEGLGLGLAICRSIVEEHDGRIWAKANHPGLKVTFTIPI